MPWFEKHANKLQKAFLKAWHHERDTWNKVCNLGNLNVLLLQKILGDLSVESEITENILSDLLDTAKTERITDNILKDIFSKYGMEGLAYEICQELKGYTSFSYGIISCP